MTSPGWLCAQPAKAPVDWLLLGGPADRHARGLGRQNAVATPLAMADHLSAPRFFRRTVLAAPCGRPFCRETRQAGFICPWAFPAFPACGRSRLLTRGPSLIRPIDRRQWPPGGRPFRARSRAQKSVEGPALLLGPRNASLARFRLVPGNRPRKPVFPPPQLFQPGFSLVGARQCDGPPGFSGQGPQP